MNKKYLKPYINFKTNTLFDERIAADIIDGSLGHLEPPVGEGNEQEW